MKNIMLLNNSYEVLNFISEKRCLKFLAKEKVEIISYWEEIVIWSSGEMKLPSIIRLKEEIKRNYRISHFSRKEVVKRDKSSCLYCGIKLTPSQVTIDHVIPRSKGGNTSFTNCVTSCHDCNNKKADRTPEQAGLVLLKKPIHPLFSSYEINQPQYQWHQDWDSFLSSV